MEKTTYEIELIQQHTRNFLVELEAMGYIRTIEHQICLCVPIQALDAVKRDYKIKEV